MVDQIQIHSASSHTEYLREN